MMGSVCISLVISHLTPDPSPAKRTLFPWYNPGTSFTELSRDIVYRLRYRQEVNAYAMEGDMSDGTKDRDGR